MKRLELNLAVDPVRYPGIRLDVALTDELKRRLPHVSRATLKPFFQQRQILLAERSAAPSTLLPPGTHAVTILGWEESVGREAPRARPSERGPFLPVIHEDERLLVLDKSSGTPSVPHAPDETETAVGAALAHWPGLVDIGFGGLEPGLLHRLDTGTSGLLVFAKTTEEFHRLRALWKSGGVRKVYRAFAKGQGPVPPIPCELHWLLAHDEKSAKRMVAFSGGIRAGSRYRGKPMETITRLVRSHDAAPGSGLDVEIEIETGVMHQIRCTLAALGWPIVGDPIYGGEKARRLWLHAWKFDLPLESGNILNLEAPLPEGWK